MLFQTIITIARNYYFIHSSIDDEDNMSENQNLRSNDRACKGRRYQEFKDQALGRKGNARSNLKPGERGSLDGKQIFLVASIILPTEDIMVLVFRVFSYVSHVSRFRIFR